jgi:hypothetical protein
LGFGIAEAVRAEMAFNASGAGRKIENRQKDGGKQVTQPLTGETHGWTWLDYSDFRIRVRSFNRNYLCDFMAY